MTGTEPARVGTLSVAPPTSSPMLTNVATNVSGYGFIDDGSGTNKGLIVGVIPTVGSAMTIGKVTDLAPLKPRPESRCVFELVYFARPDSSVFRTSVDSVRRELGRRLAQEHPVPGADVVFSVPDSSNAMALGYAEASGVKLEHGLIRNHYVGRTFINPTQALRVAKVKIKFNPVREVIAGRKCVVVDDSLVRGTT